MGSACCKSDKHRNSPENHRSTIAEPTHKRSAEKEIPLAGTGTTIAINSMTESHRKLSEDAIELQTKKMFQLAWERQHSEAALDDVSSVWELSRNLGIHQIMRIYDFDRGKDIGSGHYGTVRRARLKIEPTKTYAVKTVDKAKLKGDINILRNELEMLRSADHPNIIQFFEIFQEEQRFHFVMEYCEGGDITTRLETAGPYEESKAREIIFQTLLSINHLHSLGIIHRDIKPDNFLFKSKTSGSSTIKLIDFGLSKRAPSHGKLKSVLGTPYYVAPEILERKGYDGKCDVWSAGVMMYLLLAADFPFKGQTQQATFDKIKKDTYNLSATEQLRRLSTQGRNVLAKLLAKDPNKRYTAREALRDPWFDQLNMDLNERGKKILNRSLLDRLRTFKAESKFVKEVIRLLVMIHDDVKEVIDLKDAFFYLDVLSNGVINDIELKKAFTDMGYQISDTEVEEIIHSLEVRTHNVVSYTEFVMGCIDSSFYTNSKYLQEAFHRFDINQDGYISYGDISDCFSRFGVEMPREEILKMLTDGDLDKDSRISFTEFTKLMNVNIHAGRSPKPMQKLPDTYEPAPM